MVGDSLAHDVAGAREVGMRGILLARGPVHEPAAIDAGVEVIHSLSELVGLVTRDRPA
jgi:FMN phosphatase YigB (HAD superfamily)